MNYLLQHPLGATVPDSVHAVCCSLPTMADVIGYEERNPATMAAVKYAYPRFVFHDYVVQAANLAAKKHDLEGRAVYAVASAAAAWSLAEYVGAPSHGILPESDFVLAHFPESPEARARAKSFLQHTGASITSRQAEDYLSAANPDFPVQAEELFDGDAEKHVMGCLRQYLDTPHLWLANSGMNAFYAAIQAVRAVQRPKGRRLYLQLGWLYLDTQRILEKLMGEGDQLIVLHDVFDRAALEKLFAEKGRELSAVVTELPTNPLVQTPDIERLSALCQRHGVARVFDPSVAGIVNVNVLPYADVVVSSLTKYAAWQGDVMIGALAINKGSLFSEAIAAKVGRHLELPYPRDLSRLAMQIGEMPGIAARVNANAAEIAAYLENHPKVRRVFHPHSGPSSEHFARLARSNGSLGGIITFELEKPLARFYDRSTVVKGPSFGTHFTMMCPFMFLAHYDLAANEEGRAWLKGVGIDPDLIRLSVGAEPLADIRAALAAGLDD